MSAQPTCEQNTDNQEQFSFTKTSALIKVTPWLYSFLHKTNLGINKHICNITTYIFTQFS